MLKGLHKLSFVQKRYKNIIHPLSSVGALATVQRTRLAEHTLVNQYAYLSNSVFDAYSIAGRNAYVESTDIGRFSGVGQSSKVGLWEHNLKGVTWHGFYMTKMFGGFVKENREYDYHERTTIGNDVWIGTHSVVLKGVSIGDGAIVGAGSVVTKDVAPYTIVVGNPARVLRVRFDEEMIAFLLKVQWWNFPREVLQDMVNKRVWDEVDAFRTYVETYLSMMSDGAIVHENVLPRNGSRVV